jgi:hypothetical protein
VAEFHIDVNGVYHASAISLVVIPAHGGQHAFGLKLMFLSKLQEPNHLA